MSTRLMDKILLTKSLPVSRICSVEESTAKIFHKLVTFSPELTNLERMNTTLENLHLKPTKKHQ